MNNVMLDLETMGSGPDAAMGEHLAEQEGQSMYMAKRVEELEGLVTTKQSRVGAVVRPAGTPIREIIEAAYGFAETGLSADERAAGQLRLDALRKAMVQEGWQLVPVVPTRAMREAFHQAHEEWESGEFWRVDSPDHQWKAMLAAAPKPEGEEA